MIYAVTPYGRAGPSSRVRVFEWLDRISVPAVVSGYISHRNARPSHLARHPFALLEAERRLRRMAAERPPHLLLHREASPLSRGGLERRLLSSATFSVYDFDDALQWDHGTDSLVRRFAPKAPKARAAARLADRVIAGSPILAEWASEHNRDVRLVPSCVSPDAYKRKTDYRVADPPRLGWIGSDDNERYLLLITPALREVHRRTGARLTLIGTTRRTLGDLEALIDRVPWSEATQHAMIAEMDLGIAPTPDELYERGKCGYKLLQYGAAGTPFVASPVGINRQLLAQFDMPAPESHDQWVGAILDCLDRPTGTREALGHRARELTEEHYSYDAWLPRWKEAVGVE